MRIQIALLALATLAACHAATNVPPQSGAQPPVKSCDNGGPCRENERPR